MGRRIIKLIASALLIAASGPALAESPASAYAAKIASGEVLTDVLNACRFVSDANGAFRVKSVSYDFRRGERLTIAVAADTEESGAVRRYILRPMTTDASADAERLLFSTAVENLEVYGWSFDKNGEIDYAGVPPTEFPVEIPCANPDVAIAALRSKTLFRADYDAIADPVERAYERYRRGLARAPDGDALIAACAFPKEARPQQELMDAGFIDEPTGDYAGAVHLLTVLHDENGKTFNALFFPAETMRIQKTSPWSLRVSSAAPDVGGFSSMIDETGKHWPANDFQDESFDMHLPCADAEAGQLALQALRAHIEPR